MPNRYPYVEVEVGGCHLTPDSRDIIAAGSAPLMYSSMAEADYPHRISIEGWMPTEDQSSQGACFPAGTLVTMEDGCLLPIEEVKFGHRVVTHEGRSRQVIDTMQRPTKELIEVFVKGWNRIRMTPDHPALVVRGDVQAWVRADELEVDDLVVISDGPEPRPVESVDLFDYLDGDCTVDGSEISVFNSSLFINRYVEIDELMCWVLGLYVAEGSVDANRGGRPHRITFTTHESEQSNRDAVHKLVNRIGGTFSEQYRKGSKACNARWVCAPMARFISSICNRGANLKEAPHFIMTGTQSQKKAFLRGWFAGDGTFKKLCSKRVAGSGSVATVRQVVATTASRRLAAQVGTIAVSIGYKPGRSISKKRPHQRFSSNQVYFYGKDAYDLAGREVDFCSPNVKKRTDHGQLRKIRELKRIDADVDVYDITVAEDHSFVADGIVVHNCQGFSLHTNAEYLYYLKTGQHIQLSPACGYYESQRIDRIVGDRGSMIEGGAKLLTGEGIVTAADWPYPPRYDPTRPAGYASMPKFLAERWTALNTYKDVLDHLGTRSGAVHIGIMWGSDIDRQVSRDGIVRSWRPGGGGHSVTLGGYDREKGSAESPWIRLYNSWSERWGDKGECWVTPEAITQMLQHRWSVFVGFSGIKLPPGHGIEI